MVHMSKHEYEPASSWNQIHLLPAAHGAVDSAASSVEQILDLHAVHQKLEQEVQRKQLELQLLYNLWERLDYTLSYTDLFQLLMHDVFRAIPYDVAAGIVDNQWMVDSPHPLDSGMLDELQDRMQSTATALGMKRPAYAMNRILSNITRAPNGRTPIQHLKSVIQVPLVVGSEQKINGLLMIGAEAENAFSQDDIRFLYAIAYHAGNIIYRLQALLNSEEQRLHNVVEVLPSGVLLLDKHRHLVTANPVGTKLLSYLTKIRIGQKLDQLNGQPISYFLKTTAAQKLFVEVKRQLKVIELSAHRMEAGPQAGGWVLVLNDISARVKSEAEEHEQRVFAEALAEISSALNSTLDLEQLLTCILANVAQVVPHHTATLFLTDGEYLVGARETGHEKSGAAGWLETFTVDISGEPHWRSLMATPEGTIVPDTQTDPLWKQYDHTQGVRSSLMVPIHQDGVVVGLLNVDSDRPHFFTQEHLERLKAFANQAGVAIKNARLYDAARSHAADLEARVFDRTYELEQTTRRIETILNSSNDAIILADYLGNITDVNAPFEHLFGRDRAAALGMSLSSLTQAEFAPILEQAIQQLLTGATLPPLEVIALRADNPTSFYADIRLTLIEGMGGRPGAIVCNLRDISTHKRAERDLQSALEKERRLVELKNQFITITSHEFRTPMSLILSSAELLEIILTRNHFGTLPENISRHITKICNTVDHMTTMLEEVLFIGKSDANKVPFQPEQVDIYEFCEHQLEEFWLNKDRSHRLEKRYDGERQLIEADPNLLRNILANLLTNAIKYSPDESTIHFALSFCDGCAEVSVRDEGIGIPLEDQPRLFDTFYRAGNVGNIPGTGLGLAILKRAVDAHNGSIHFESQSGQGTTFRVKLPIRQAKPSS